MTTSEDKGRSMYSNRWRGTCRLVRITGSAVRTRGPIAIHSASAYVMFAGAETRNFQKKSQAFNMTRKQILKSCYGNPKTRKSTRAHNLSNSNVITIWKLLFCICLFYFVFKIINSDSNCRLILIERVSFIVNFMLYFTDQYNRNNWIQ